MIEAATLPGSYFDAVYAASDDPWDFEGSAYEAAKYRATIEALAPRHFASALEIGCSIGVFTAMLAPLCDEVLAIDVSEAALARARARCHDAAGVRFARLQVPDEFPDRRFDLVTTCEVAYYWARDDFDRAAASIEDSLLLGGLWLLVHWTPAVADYPLGGDEVHELLAARVPAGAPLRHVKGWRQPQYRLDLYEKTGARPGGR